jgi:putative transposase
LERVFLVKKLLFANNRWRISRGYKEIYRKAGGETVNKAFKFRIYPNKEQRILMAKTFGCKRFIYNLMLADHIEHYERTGESLNNTPAQYKNEFEWLKEVDSLALANAQLNLNQAYKNFFRNKIIGFQNSS